jgi:hypothetical protein
LEPAGEAPGALSRQFGWRRKLRAVRSRAPTCRPERRRSEGPECIRLRARVERFSRSRLTTAAFSRSGTAQVLRRSSSERQRGEHRRVARTYDHAYRIQFLRIQSGRLRPAGALLIGGMGLWSAGQVRSDAALRPARRPKTAAEARPAPPG